jgi:thiol peroxidase
MASVTLKGNPVELSGELPQVGQPAPDFELTANDLSTVRLSDDAGKVRIISAIPSVDTPVCSIETKRFNTEVDNLPEDVVFYTVSVDTPFAQKRWCGAEGVEKIKLLSDYKNNNKFGHDYGLYIANPLGAHARAIFIVGKDDTIAYSQLVPEIAQEPDYDEVLAKARELSA